MVPSSCTFNCQNVKLCDKNSSAQTSMEKESKCGSPRTRCLAISGPIIELINRSRVQKSPRAWIQIGTQGKDTEGPPVLVLPRAVWGETQVLYQGIKFFIFQAWNPSRWTNSRVPSRLHGHWQRETGHITACRTAFWEKSDYGICSAGARGTKRGWLLRI